MNVLACFEQAKRTNSRNGWLLRFPTDAPRRRFYTQIISATSDMGRQMTC